MQNSRTGALWIQYMKMVDILRKHIKAERTGNWMLHLEADMDMLPFFAASGHNLYAKSARLYVQNMLALKITAPRLHDDFMNELYTVRRSDRYWAGLSTDLVIVVCVV